MVETLLLIIMVTVIFVIIGTTIYDKVNFKLPIIESIISKEKVPDKNEILKYGIIGGVISGILMTLISVIFIPFFRPLCAYAIK